MLSGAAVAVAVLPTLLLILIAEAMGWRVL
ncbi:hypothetical protein SMD11_0142 [Streptomyces albireticuli]|uniref:Uncharacterized protein n=1 Tax=Streptomyces albireticuli TaxID=1940 RepID=A0A1Z2KUS3_9ACTN|nr:hypothetical protein SMD11_0142 [Streptomyces albireticuli]